MQTWGFEKKSLQEMARTATMQTWGVEEKSLQEMARTAAMQTWGVEESLHFLGLQLSFLHQHDFPSEKALIVNFKEWLQDKNALAMYANDPRKSQVLNMTIKDMAMPPWPLSQHPLT